MASRRSSPMRFIVLSAVAAAIVLIIRVLRGPRVPAFDATTTEPVAWPELGPLRAPVPADPAAPGSGWAEPNTDGDCPGGYPVKGNRTSGIFHVPDGAFYERTTPDRCYLDATAAEADGLRQAKR